MPTKETLWLLFLALVSAFSLAQTVAAQSATEEPLMINRLLKFKTVSGNWQLNRAESEDVMQKMREKISNMTSSLSTKKGDAAETTEANAPPLSVSLFPPEDLILAESGDQSEVTINEGFQNVVLTRTFQTNGKAQNFQMVGGAVFSVRAMQNNDGKIVVETVSPRGNKMIETYELAPTADKLYVTLHIEKPDAQELLTLRRVYNRAAVQLFLEDSESNEIR